MLKLIRIRRHETGLMFKNGDFAAVLGPGLHRLFGVDVLVGRRNVETFNRLATQFEHRMPDVLVGEAALREALTFVDLKDDERALVWKDGRLGWILGPGRFAFWKQPATVQVETFNVNDFRFAHPKLEAVINHAGGARHFDGVRVEPHERVLLFREGKLESVLEPGLHVYWKGSAKVFWKTVDLREQTLDIAGQEIMTADKVTLRVNPVLTYQVTDVVKTATVAADYQQALYREAQLVLRAAIGTRRLDALRADKESIGGEIKNALASRAAEFGVTLRSMGVRDIVLPGDMKTLLNQVIEAQKQAEANLIKRREQTAAARRQLNTAKLLAENPLLARMKELEMLQEILGGAQASFFFGQGDLAQQIRQLVTAQPAEKKA